MVNNIKCILCNKDIKNYSEKFNQFKIDELRSVNVCSNCVDKFSAWQIDIAKELFPRKKINRS